MACPCALPTQCINVCAHAFDGSLHCQASFARVLYSQIPSPCILFGILEYLRRRRQNNLLDLCEMHVVSMLAARRWLDQFCDLKGEHCDGLADFVIIWRLRDGQWQATRVLSYAHRPATP